MTVDGSEKEDVGELLIRPGAILLRLKEHKSVIPEEGKKYEKSTKGYLGSPPALIYDACHTRAVLHLLHASPHAHNISSES